MAAEGLRAGQGESADGARRMAVDFLYLDLRSCDRCLSTEDSLDAALSMLRPVLDEVGIEVAVRKVLVESEEQARAWQLVSSPTIRVNDHDVAAELTESACGPCSDLCGDQTLCRVWRYQGKEYTAAPVGLLVDAILGQAYGPQRGTGEHSGGHAAAAGDTPGNGGFELPENLRAFFARGREAPGAGGCCPPGGASLAAGACGSGPCCGSDGPMMIMAVSESPIPGRQEPGGDPSGHGLDPSEIGWPELRARLAGFIARRVGDRDAAEDLVQEVLARIHSRIGTLDDARRFDGWAYQITRNVITDYFRSRGRTELPADPHRLLASSDSWVTGPAEPHTAQFRAELSLCLAPMIDRLPPAYRDAVLLTEFDGLAQREAARRLGLSLPAMKARVRRGRAQLKAMLVECCRIELDRRGGIASYAPRTSAPAAGCCPAEPQR
jgi:RNA polymerase sigma-70 factor, ECF subfamily